MARHVHPERPKPRPTVGFLALLTPEQRAAALAYDGPDVMGDAADPIARQRTLPAGATELERKT